MSIHPTADFSGYAFATAALDDPPVLVSEERPSREQQIGALNAALRAAKQQQKGGGR